MFGTTVLRTRGMAKGMTFAGLVVAGLILLMFGLDLAITIPFNRASVIMDVIFIVCGLGLAFLSWSTLKDFD